MDYRQRKFAKKNRRLYEKMQKHAQYDFGELKI